ncbi:hypothetical protein [Janthinobacterium sp. PAMC25594]|uniref:hypothetical protein n=1 Tax=Janthinobacterium sp. PAMC25594 TaxID=2861284 RepID=UPI001C62AACD|nr:hypothetical protein [Janthinobacterium sp. PAMC25594]QYG08963.1 hypothetical protein KY494_09575 [Janthinobacterium sp. PAMC25594]
MKNIWRVSLASLLLTVTGAFAATPPVAPTVEVNQAVRVEVIDTLIAKLNAHYVFPDKAKQVEVVLRQHQREGKYNRVTDGQQLAKQLAPPLPSSHPASPPGIQESAACE